jgi:dinuclear metal center YbgI/SA1388 family protein
MIPREREQEIEAMATTLTDLLHYLAEYLQPDRFNDYCPNGLQVEGRSRVVRLASGVTACQALLDEAIAWGADAILVHHGYFWKGERSVITGMKRRRLAALLANDVSLLAYHLPLDAHPEVGNNARLGALLGIAQHEPLHPGGVGSVGNLPGMQTAGELVARLEQLTGRSALHVGATETQVRRIAWCTGAAQGYIGAAVSAGAEMYVTGEASEQTVHVAREEGIHFVAAGHHATERFGVQALGEHLAVRFALAHRFIDIDNPV